MKIDIGKSLPVPHFAVKITREAEFEISAIPDSRAEMKAWIYDAIDRSNIEVVSLFGFADPNLPADQQRVAGLGEGVWATQEELAFFERIPIKSDSKKRGSRLYPDEADRAVAAKSFGSVVLTNENPSKSGPMRSASLQGGTIANICGWASDESLADFIRRSA